MSTLLQESGHLFCGIRNKEWLCWQGPAAVYPIRPYSPVTLIRRGVMNDSQIDPLFGEEEQFWNIWKVWKKKKMTETKIDCADEGQQEFSLPGTTVQSPSSEGEWWMIVRPILSSKRRRSFETCKRWERTKIWPKPRLTVLTRTNRHIP
jgi:hypothetical protein